MMSSMSFAMTFCLFTAGSGQDLPRQADEASRAGQYNYCCPDVLQCDREQEEDALGDTQQVQLYAVSSEDQTRAAQQVATTTHTPVEISYSIVHTPPAKVGSFGIEGILADHGSPWVAPEDGSSSHHDSGDPTFYFVVDLGGVKDVAAIKVRNCFYDNMFAFSMCYSYRVDDFELSMSSTSASSGYGSVVPGTLASQTQTIQEITVGLTGRYLKFMVKSYPSSPALDYLSVLGSESSPPPASATGDPHMQNVHGQPFDLAQTGAHVLVNLPRFATPSTELLRLEAQAERLGGNCADLYFTRLNVTGSLVRKNLRRAPLRGMPKVPKGMIQFNAEEGVVKSVYSFDKVTLKVVRGATQEGARYLNIIVHGLGLLHEKIGGLLGDDDHSFASTPSVKCREQLVMVQSASRVSSGKTNNTGAALAYALVRGDIF